jgi:hypothetical protein
VNASQSWAAVGKASTSSGNVVNIASRTQTKKKYIYYNEAGYRLDEPLGPKDPAAFQAIESRMKKVGMKPMHVMSKANQKAAWEEPLQQLPSKRNVPGWRQMQIPAWHKAHCV